MGDVQPDPAYVALMVALGKSAAAHSHSHHIRYGLRQEKNKIVQRLAKMLLLGCPQTQPPYEYGRTDKVRENTYVLIINSTAVLSQW